MLTIEPLRTEIEGAALQKHERLYGSQHLLRSAQALAYWRAEKKARQPGP